MLTRQLLRVQVRQGRIRPRLVDPDAAPLQGLAANLIGLAAAGAAAGDSCGMLTAALAAAAGDDPIARGLAKLVQGRCAFAEPDAEASERRLQVLRDSSAAWRAAAPSADADAALAALQLRLAALPSAGLYDDLPERRPQQSFAALTPTALLQRYNLALVQGLVLCCRTLTLHTADADVARLRHVLRWLKFCRLVAAVHHDPAAGRWSLQLSGPAEMLECSKKYGLQLAQFVLVVPCLQPFELVAEVAWRPGAAAARSLTLQLTEADGLVPAHGPARGHVPPEVAQLAAALGDGPWRPQGALRPRHVGAADMLVPDLSLAHDGDGRQVDVEIFHRWHQGPLQRRCAQLAGRPDGALVLGIDSRLPLPEGGVPAGQAHFTFREYPSARRLQAALAALPPAGAGAGAGA